MLLKLAIFLGLAAACLGFKNASCEGCFSQGTYRCGATREKPCECHVGFTGIMCEMQTECIPNECVKGTCVFQYENFECVCDEGAWGRRCEHSDSEVDFLNDVEKELEKKYCGDNKDAYCYPPHLQVSCDTENHDYCDEDGKVLPFKKCPYPWYCFDAFRNGRCDWECERSECHYDGYECSTDRPCSDECILENGKCDLECSYNVLIDDFPAIGSTIMRFHLNISEQFWWEKKKEIIASLSEPLRTPLLYHPQYNKGLCRNKKLLDETVNMNRHRRSLSEDSDILTVSLLMPKVCTEPYQCATNGYIGGPVLSTAFSKENPAAIVVDDISVSVIKEEGIGKGVLIVCFFIIILPIVLIGYRTINAPIWFPPKSEDDVPMIWFSEVAPLNPFERKMNPLHEEAYSLSKIRLPIKHEYVNGMDEQGRTPLFWLIGSKKNSVQMLVDVNELMVAGANPNHSDDKGDTPLSIAITSLRPSICNRLVQWGSDPAATTHSGASCLHLAVAQDDVKCVQWLLDFPSVRNNINEVDESDRTPLAMTAQGGLASAEIAEVLIEAGADVLHQGNHYTMWRYRGRTALHWAALFNNLEVMKVLIDYRSDVNCLDTEGCSSLHLAVQRGSETASRMLLEAHASPETPNGLGFTPLSIAKKSGNQMLIDLLNWYTDVRKEALPMKSKGTKREKRSSESGSEYSKRSCYSPFFSDSTSNHSGSISSGVFFPSSDSSSIGSGMSTTSFCSGSSHPWSPPPSIISSPMYLVPKTCRQPALTPIQEKPLEQCSLDSVISEEYVPPGALTTITSLKNDRMNGRYEENGDEYDFSDSIMLSPYSETSNGSAGAESPHEHLGAGYCTDKETPVDGFTQEELLHEFFVDWQN